MKQFTRRTERFFENAGYLMMGSAIGSHYGCLMTLASAIALFSFGAALVAFCMIDLLWMEV